MDDDVLTCRCGCRRARLPRVLMWTAMVLTLTLGPVGFGSASADVQYIDISNPFLRKIPMAVPEFKPLTPNAAESRLAGKVSQRLVQLMHFSRYFKMLDRGSFLYDPLKEGITTNALNFGNWTAVGAELLITGGIQVVGQRVQIELRLFDTFKQKLVVGKRYSGSPQDTERMVRRFGTEVLRALTRSGGFFNSKIAFVSNGSGHKELYLCDFDGANVQRITRHGSISLFPSWSFDGRHLAYTTYAMGRPEIAIRNMYNLKERFLKHAGVQISPSWRPKRYEFAATLSFTGDQEIYLLTGAGKIIKRLTNSRGIDVDATWSPDGKKLAFVSKRSGTPQIYVKELSSGKVNRLTYHGRYNTQPSWSPKGDMIAYSSMGQGQINILVSDFEGNPPLQLTRDQADNEAPSWSPDGSLIAFNSTRSGKSRIYVMTAYGTDPRPLLALEGEQTNPRWSPNLPIN